MLRIVALVLVLLFALAGYHMGMDGGQITLFIIVLAVIMWGLWYAHKKYGTKRMLGAVVSGALTAYDPMLPPLFSEAEPFENEQNTFSDTDGSHPLYGPLSNPSPELLPNVPRAYMAQQGRTTIQQVPGPDIQGSLTDRTAGRMMIPPLPVSPAYAPLPQATQYELHLGASAFIDVQQAFINALVLDPTGNVVRVMAEELAAKVVPLLFVDIDGAYNTLLGEFPLGWRICSPASQQEGPIDPRAIRLDRDSNEEAKHIGRTILQEGWQVLFQFSSYASPIDAAITLFDIVQGMREWEIAQHRRSGRLLPAVIFITDAYRFCPDANQHSIFREIDTMAQAVRTNVIQALKTAGQDGLYWYLATRKITGMEQQVLRHCALWMVHQPSATEVQSGWITAYTGLEPQELRLIPQTHVMIFDLATRNPQLIAFRDSRSQGSSQNTSIFTLRALQQLSSPSPLPENIPPFQNR